MNLNDIINIVGREKVLCAFDYAYSTTTDIVDSFFLRLDTMLDEANAGVNKDVSFKRQCIINYLESNGLDASYWHKSDDSAILKMWDSYWVNILG